MTRLVPALLLALAACPPAPVPADLAPTPGPPEQPAAPPAAAPTCAARDALGDLAWIPRDLRLAALFDLQDPGLDDAAARLARDVAGLPGLPIVAGLGLAQLGIQLPLLRRQLRAADLDPAELLLLHEPGGGVLWLLRARCDLPALQSTLARAWGVQSRTSAAGPLAEPRPGGGFAFDVLFLSDDRLALVPAGSGGKLRRWLEAPPAADPFATTRPSETPGELLAAIDRAPIRVVFGGRGLLAGDAPHAPRGLQAWPDRVVTLPAAPP